MKQTGHKRDDMKACKEWWRRKGVISLQIQTVVYCCYCNLPPSPQVCVFCHTMKSAAGLTQQQQENTGIKSENEPIGKWGREFLPVKAHKRDKRKVTFYWGPLFYLGAAVCVRLLFLCCRFVCVVSFDGIVSTDYFLCYPGAHAEVERVVSGQIKRKFGRMKGGSPVPFAIWTWCTKSIFWGCCFSTNLWCQREPIWLTAFLSCVR
jgi:hypothetical protein